MNPSRSARRRVAAGCLFLTAVLFLPIPLAGLDSGQPQSPGAPIPPWLQALWQLGNDGKPPNYLALLTVAALALLVAFLTVAELWQVPPPSTSLAQPSRQAAGAKPKGAGDGTAPSRPAANLLDSNFSRTVLSGLGGLAVLTVAGKLWDASFRGDSYYLVLFVLCFLTFLMGSALLRGLGEALRSRIILSRPAVLWPPLPPWLPAAKDTGSSPPIPRSYRLWQWVRYWGRRGWYWVGSFRATVLVFLDTAFNVLIGRNQLQSAVFSETITDLHESLLEAAGRVRDEVHRAVIEALIRKGELPQDMPHEERVRVAVSLLSEDESSVYYIAWERGSSPQRFPPHSVAWLAAFTGEARWAKVDLPGATKKYDPLYKDNPQAVLFHNQKGVIPGNPPADLLLDQYYQGRGTEDYEAFVMLPMPWTNRGWAGEHRRGAIHISFKKASYMKALWDNLEVSGSPNYGSWKGLLDDTADQPSGSVPPGLLRRAETLMVQSPQASAERRALESLAETSRTVEEEYAALLSTVGELERQSAGSQKMSIVIQDAELCSVLHQALEVLGAALAHFDDEVYDVYVRARQHPTMAAR